MCGEAEKGALTKANETKTKTRPDRYDISFSHRSAKRSKHNCVCPFPSMLVMPDHGYITISVHKLLALHIGETLSSILHRGGSDSGCCSVRISEIMSLLWHVTTFFRPTELNLRAGQARHTDGWIGCAGMSSKGAFVFELGE